MMMAKQKKILVTAVCFLMGIFAVRALSQRFIPPPHFELGMTGEEYRKRMEEWTAQRQQQRREDNWRIVEFGNVVVMELRKQTLGLTKRQWELIKPKYEKVKSLRREAHVRILTRVSRRVSRNHDQTSFHWKKLSEDNYFRKAKAPAELTEGERIAEELIDLLEDKNSTDEVIRRKINALQQVRENAQRELAKAEEELVKVLTPRQEAVLLLWEFID
jgi:hypothetical protein